MRLRTVVLTASVLGLAASLTATADAATAKKKPVCNLITDGTGDGGNRVTRAPSSDALDIVGGDIATGKGTVVGVLRLKGYNLDSDPAAYLGFNWNLRFTIKGTTYAFTYADGRGAYAGPSAAFMMDSAQIATPTVKVAGNTITWSVKRSAVPGLKKSGQTLINLAATSGYDMTSADAASTTKTYPDLYPSCVKAS
ncbi:MAG TPA: hypothetical protein VFQ85_03380 [Mycobacteriales bacterium]|jgi:hypothetical protein|nr:hypothetical protein [Mycobacteriales bacterium]